MKILNDLKLCKKSRKIVEEWLQEWLTLFEEQANHKEAWVYRCDFAKNDFFWFTNCKDILEKDPEAKGQENNLAIRSRKRKVMMQLFLKTLMGKNLGLITITCNHCAYRGCWIESLKDGNGHWVYCPKCKKTDIHVFPGGYDTCINTIKQEIAKKIYNMNDYPVLGTPAPVLDVVPTPLLKMNPKCKELIKEIQSYKYEHAVKNTHDPGSNPKPKKPSKRKVPKGAWSTVIKGDQKCDKCGASSKKVPFDYAVGLCNDCYYKEAGK